MTLLSSQKSFAVKYEAALVLVGTTSSSAAIRQASQCFIDILNNESDNNVKLIVLEKLSELKRDHETVLQDLLMDMLRALSAYVPQHTEAAGDAGLRGGNVGCQSVVFLV